MPLLPPEPFLSPEDLLGRPAPEAELPARWWCLHTRPRAEKALARALLAQGAAFFLPVHRKRWRSSGRWREAHLPLFPGYLFLLGDDADRVRATETRLVARALGVEDQQGLKADLTRVHRLMVAGQPLTPEGRLRPGDSVRIAAGPLAGLEGRLLRRAGTLRLVVEVQLLQQGVSVEVEAWTVEALGGRLAEDGDTNRLTAK